jgi:hypothetical protein
MFLAIYWFFSEKLRRIPFLNQDLVNCEVRRVLNLQERRSNTPSLH